MAKPELGGKRLCQSCATKFYDLNRDPILCPKCGAQFVVPVLSGRPGPANAAAADDDEVVLDPAAEAMVPLAEADAAADPAAGLVVDDIEIEDDPADTDSFLEEEEEGSDDVADLIDGDIEPDEEG